MTVVHLKARVPRATIRCAEKILENAVAGRCTGLAFVAIMPDGFIADACGEAHNDPEVCRQMLAVLDAKLARRTLKKKTKP